MKSILLLSIAAISIAAPLSAEAQISEIRAGVTAHDVSPLGIGSTYKAERSAGLNGEIIFDKPDILKWALAPRPYIGGTVNLEGETSYAGAGLLWRQGVGEKFYGDFAFGLAVHNGETESENFFDFFNQIQHGSRVLFREQLTLGYRVSDGWAVEIFSEHYSNGGVLSARRNEGADTVGMRAAKRF